MQYRKKIHSEIEFNKTFRLITQAYEEIAVMKMRKVRNSVLSTRDYLLHLGEVFFELKREKERLKKLVKIQFSKKKAKGKEKLSLAELSKILAEDHTTEKINRTVSVLLSANTTLYGDLIQRIFNLFINNVNRDNSDIIIVGRVGKRLYDQQEKKKPYTYFEIPDFEIRLEDLKPIIFNLVKYEKIVVYYGKFESILNQKEVASIISGDQPYAFSEDNKSKNPESKPDVNSKQQNFNNSVTSSQFPSSGKEGKKGRLDVSKLDNSGRYLFEPDINKILSFFEDLIASSLLRQTVHETQLARWASRIMSMESAQGNISQELKKLRGNEIKMQKQEQNSKQLERLAGLSLWRS
ncbi:hypothetical protein A2963_02750 [Candidatus Roizmanbacteria bacterium RIFCSPLOWO2_01_FULL_40_13]|nr:MAG: hypothetical protein A2963_02750 [Candidatus Roizmanbacteria bacterium RIFCSPLOWO2_01_FULL_40_13]